MRSLIILLWFVPLAANAQLTEYEGFRIENRELIWQAVVDTAIDFETMSSYYHSMAGFQNLSYNDNSILVDVLDFAIDYRKYGKRGMSLPIVSTAYNFSGKLRVDVKPDRYRITFFGAYMTPITPAPLLSSGTMTFHLLKNNRESIRQSCATDNIMGLFDRYFFDYFRVKQTYVDDDF